MTVALCAGLPNPGDRSDRNLLATIAILGHRPDSVVAQSELRRLLCEARRRRLTVRARWGR